jgi:hypothetical protein
MPTHFFLFGFLIIQCRILASNAGSVCEPCPGPPPPSCASCSPIPPALISSWGGLHCWPHDKLPDTKQFLAPALPQRIQEQQPDPLIHSEVPDLLKPCYDRLWIVLRHLVQELVLSVDVAGGGVCRALEGFEVEGAAEVCEEAAALPFPPLRMSGGCHLKWCEVKVVVEVCVVATALPSPPLRAAGGRRFKWCPASRRPICQTAPPSGVRFEMPPPLPSPSPGLRPKLLTPILTLLWE